MLNYTYFAKKPPQFQDINMVLWDLHNTVIDSFVNYILSDYNEIYKEYFKYLEAVFKRGIDPPDYHSYICGYLEFVIEFNYILKDQKEKIESNYLSFIRKMSFYMQNIFGLNKGDFEAINVQLSKFSNVITTLNCSNIKDFDFNLLKLLKLVDNVELVKKIEFMYPEL